MTLTARVSVFFLAVLAAVLMGFSGALFWLTRVHLYRQVDERLESAIQTLAAAAEEDGPLMEWEPKDRRLTLGQADTIQEVRWLVSGRQNEVIDSSPNLASNNFLADRLSELENSTVSVSVVQHQGETWRLIQRCLSSSETVHSPDSPATPNSKGRHPILILTAALSLKPTQATLWNLAATSITLSVGLWMLAALAGRWLCRRALVPVTLMAQTARTMNGAHLDRRLPSPDTHDELEDLSHAFNDLLNRLQESFERQQRFTGDASHQLRTPLTSMLGQMEVALRRGRSADDYRHVLNQVNEQAGRLHQIVEMLLFLARADAEAQFPQGEKLYLTVWLRDHLKARSGHKRADDLRLESSEKEPLWVLAQPALLGQLVDNLLDNACKYSQPGSPITLRVSREEQSVLLTVKDKGQGISADDIGHVFEPFYRSSEMRQKGIGGIGLGLSVARRIASAFGGSIEVKSEPGSGTEFVLRFPDPTDVTHDMNSSACHNGPIVENRDRMQA